MNQTGQTLSWIVTFSKHHAGTYTALSHGNMSNGIMLMNTQSSVSMESLYLLVYATELETTGMTGAGIHLRAPGCGCFEGAGFAGVLGFAGGFCCARGGLCLAGAVCLGFACAGFVGALGFAWAGGLLEGGACCGFEAGGFFPVVGMLCFAGGAFEDSSDRTDAESCSMQHTILLD